MKPERWPLSLTYHIATALMFRPEVSQSFALGVELSLRSRRLFETRLPPS